MAFELTAPEENHRQVLEKWRNAMDLVGPGPLDPHFEDAAQAWAVKHPMKAKMLLISLAGKLLK